MQLVVTQAKTLQAFNWIKNGWRLFTLQPGPFMAMSGLLIILNLVSSVLPPLNFIFAAAVPFLTIGIYRAASEVEQGNSVGGMSLFYYLSKIKEFAVLLRIAAVMIALSIPATVVFMDAMEKLSQQQAPEFSTIAFGVLCWGLALMASAFAIPAAWVSPKQSLKALITQSFQACGRNIKSLTLYAALLFLITLAGGVVLGIVWALVSQVDGTGALASIVLAPMLLVGTLMFNAFNMLSFYQAFLDIYQPEQSPAATDEDDDNLDDDELKNESTEPTLEQDQESQKNEQEQPSNGVDQEPRN